MLNSIIERTLRENFYIDGTNIKSYNVGRDANINFVALQYNIKKIGTACSGSSKKLLGLVKTENFVIIPTEVDGPMFSYERIRAIGIDGARVDLFKTLIKPTSLKSFDTIKEKYQHLDDGAIIDSIAEESGRYPQSFAKSVKKKFSKDLEKMVLDYLNEYINFLKEAPSVDKKNKE